MKTPTTRLLEKLARDKSPYDYIIKCKFPDNPHSAEAKEYRTKLESQNVELVRQQARDLAAELAEQDAPWTSEEAKTVDFEYWKSLPSWTIEEAAWLILKRNPKVISSYIHEGAGSELFKKYDDTVDYLNRHPITQTRKPEKYLTISEIIKISKNQKFNLPNYFNTYEAVELDGKSKRSLLFLIYAMAAEKYHFNPADKKSSATGNILKATENQAIGLNEDTIKKWLTEAAKEVEKMNEKTP